MYLRDREFLDEGDQLDFEHHLVSIEDFTGSVNQDLTPIFSPAVQRKKVLFFRSSCLIFVDSGVGYRPPLLLRIIHRFQIDEDPRQLSHEMGCLIHIFLVSTSHKIGGRRRQSRCKD